MGSCVQIQNLLLAWDPRQHKQNRQHIIIYRPGSLRCMWKNFPPFKIEAFSNKVTKQAQANVYHLVAAAFAVHLLKKISWLLAQATKCPASGDHGTCDFAWEINLRILVRNCSGEEKNISAYQVTITVKLLCKLINYFALWMHHLCNFSCFNTSSKNLFLHFKRSTMDQVSKFIFKLPTQHKCSMHKNKLLQ